MTSTHLAAIHIPLSAYPTAPFHRPVNHKSVKCFSDIISRPGVGREKLRGEWRVGVWGCGGGGAGPGGRGDGIAHLAQEMGLFEDLHGGVVAS